MSTIQLQALAVLRTEKYPSRHCTIGLVGPYRVAQNNLCACHASAGAGKDESISLLFGVHWSINSDQTVSIREAMGSNLGLESGHLD
jgi:hypothetical protein